MRYILFRTTWARGPATSDVMRYEDTEMHEVFIAEEIVTLNKGGVLFRHDVNDVAIVDAGVVALAAIKAAWLKEK